MWEYLRASLKSQKQEDHLNELGAQGWELVAQSDGIAIFKRPRKAPGEIAIKESPDVPSSKPAIRERVKTGKQ